MEVFGREQIRESEERPLSLDFQGRQDRGYTDSTTSALQTGNDGIAAFTILN